MPLKKIIPILSIAMASVLALATASRAQISSAHCDCPPLIGFNGAYGPFVPPYMDQFQSVSSDGKHLVTSYGEDSYVVDLTTLKQTLLSYPLPGEYDDWCVDYHWCPYNPDLLAVTAEAIYDNDSGVANLVIFNVVTGEMSVITPQIEGNFDRLLGWAHSSQLGMDTFYIGYTAGKDTGGEEIYIPQTQALIPMSDSQWSAIAWDISVNGLDSLQGWNDSLGDPWMVLNGDSLKTPVPVSVLQSTSFSPSSKLLALSVGPVQPLQIGGTFVDTINPQVWIYNVADPNPDSIQIINFQCCFCTYSMGGIGAQFLTDSSLVVSMHKDSAESSPLYEISLDGCHIIRQLTFLPEYFEDYPMNPNMSSAGNIVADTVLTLIYNDSSFCGPPSSIYLQQDTQTIPVRLVSSRSDSLILRFEVPVGDTGTYNLVILGGGNCLGATTTVPNAFKVSTPASVTNSSTSFGGIRVFPNPSSSDLQILSGPSGTVRLFDVLGREVIDANDDGEGATLDVSRLQAGTYFLRLGTESAKVIVTH